jgi:3-phosphoshikimate 1-carboxyvinyltransferase
MLKTVVPVKKVEGSPRIPGDKSISHRSLIFGALADGVTEVTDILESEDVQSTAACLRKLGVEITKRGNQTLVRGTGIRGFSAPTEVLDCGNSGTTIRLLMGLLSGLGVKAEMTGDASLVKRPMKRVAEPLREMGARFELSRENYAPLTVTGTKLRAIRYDLKIASAQIKSAILLAALSAEGTTEVVGEIHSRDHTERFLKHFGVEVDVSSSAIKLRGGQKLVAKPVHVPGDPSTAAFWMAAATLVPGSHVRMENIALNPTRIGFIRALERMGADIRIEVTSENPEPVGRIEVRSAKLKGVTITEAEVPSLIDELPLLAVLATQAEGVTLVEGAEELRVKETDRIEAVATNLRAMGAEIEVRPDGYRIVGPQKLKGAKIESFHDHRIAMAFSIAGLFAPGETTIHGAECVAISYPEFYETLTELTRG